MVKKSIASLKTLLLEVRAFSENTPESIAVLHKKIADEKEAVEIAVTRAAEVVDALTFKVGDVNNQNRATATRLRHQRNAVGKPLKDTMWFMAIAKEIQPFLHCLLMCPKDLPEGATSPDSPFKEVLPCSECRSVSNTHACLSVPWDNEALNTNELCCFSYAGNVAKALNVFYEAQGRLQSKCESADSAMVDHPQWGGLMGKIQSEKAEVKMQLLPESAFTIKAGGEGWLFTIRKNIWRSGSQAYPVPGVPAFIKAVTAPLIIMALPIQPLLDRGITVSNYELFMKSEEGKLYLNTTVRYIRLKVGDLAWVPGDMLLHVIYWSNVKSDKGWAHGWHLPVFDSNFAASPVASIREAVKHYNDAYLASQLAKSKVNFESRVLAFNEYCQVV